MRHHFPLRRGWRQHAISPGVPRRKADPEAAVDAHQNGPDGARPVEAPDDRYSFGNIGGGHQYDAGPRGLFAIGSRPGRGRVMDLPALGDDVVMQLPGRPGFHYSDENDKRSGQG